MVFLLLSNLFVRAVSFRVLRAIWAIELTRTYMDWKLTQRLLSGQPEETSPLPR